MSIRTVDCINAELLGLWCRFLENNRKVYAPMQYKAPNTGAVVFVGLNSSFSSRGWKRLIQNSTIPEIDPQAFDPRAFFQWPRPLDFDIKLAYKLETLAREKYSFFAPHRALSQTLGLEWEHLDIFAYRETKQAEMRTVALLPGSEVNLTEFGDAQFVLFEELLSLAKPSAVVVVNALASQIFKETKTFIQSFDGLLQ